MFRRRVPAVTDHGSEVKAAVFKEETNRSANQFGLLQEGDIVRTDELSLHSNNQTTDDCINSL